MHIALPDNINKYLRKYSSDKWEIHCNKNKFKSIIVIPAIDEYDNIKILLSSLLKNRSEYFSSTLILFVVNHTINSSSDVKCRNLNTILYLNGIIENNNFTDDLSKEIINSGLQIGLVDASSKGFELDEKDGGVGLARKIGMDEALKHFDYNSSNQNILICLDADCTVSENYISTIRKTFDQQNLHAAYVNFSHGKTNNIENNLAIINYEIFLRYYVLGLKYTGSHYAYHSIGSTMVCDVDSYIKIQGMNKRKAAEDFYFMEKLSKITDIKKISEATVFPSSRGSWRVPFGTGKRVTRFLQKAQNEYLLYAPESFTILKNWIELFNSEEVLSGEDYLTKASEINKSLFDFLTTSKFKESWNNIIKSSKSENQIIKQRQLWFDGFRTLKLVHYLRDSEFPLINMFDALDQMFEMMNIPFNYKNETGEIPSIKIQEEYLQTLREIA